MEEINRRRIVLENHGAEGEVLEELLEFNRSRISTPADRGRPGHGANRSAEDDSCDAGDAGTVSAITFPLDDEPQLQAWHGYAQDAGQLGAWKSLRPRFPQLQFPIRHGMSDEELYRRATRKGEFPDATELQETLALRRPDSLELILHPTLAGIVPVLATADRSDFVTLVQAFTARNEPQPVPDSQGACLVAGLNNWDRLHTYRHQWEASDEAHRQQGAWSDEFRRIVPRKELYQDRFIILSRGPYSGVDHAALDLPEETWLAQSFQIRLEHECTHYFTLRLFGRLQHNVLEELLADFVGIVRTRGAFEPELALRFLGLEGMPCFRAGGRLENYRGTLSDAAFVVLQRVTHDAVLQLAHLFETYAGCARDVALLARLIHGLAPLTLEELADVDLRPGVATRLGGGPEVRP